jgi:hypothetical protein
MLRYKGQDVVSLQAKRRFRIQRGVLYHSPSTRLGRPEDATNLAAGLPALNREWSTKSTTLYDRPPSSNREAISLKSRSDFD